MKEGRDVDWYAAVEAADPSAGAEAEIVDAEHPLFILYTSGSTGKPKGILHTTAGYLAGTHVSSKYVFDLRDDDVYWCTADVGWVTGHSYIVYGPLSNGATCVLYEGAPNFPDWGRFWQLIDKHQVTILYTAPTAIRAFIRAGDDWVNKASLSSLRLLGTVGEPINPEAWVWYYETVGKKRCPIVDTWWQTETGSILLTTLPGAVYSKPGSTGLPFFGVEPAVVDDQGNQVDADHAASSACAARGRASCATSTATTSASRSSTGATCPGSYFTGDGARCDRDGYYWVVGRIDDVLNVSDIGSAPPRFESSLVAHEAVAEAAAVGRPDDLKGTALVVFVTLKPGFEHGDAMKKTLGNHVASEIGKFAKPDTIRFADALPKTRSGKIMRRLLKQIASGRGNPGRHLDPRGSHRARQAARRRRMRLGPRRARGRAQLLQGPLIALDAVAERRGEVRGRTERAAVGVDDGHAGATEVAADAGAAVSAGRTRESPCTPDRPRMPRSASCSLSQTHTSHGVIAIEHSSPPLPPGPEPPAPEPPKPLPP